MRRLLAPSIVLLALAFGVIATCQVKVAKATVTTSTRSVTYSPASPTTSFSITFPFAAAGIDSIKVTKITIAGGTETTLTRGVDYTVDTVLSTVTTTVAVTNTHQLRIERVTPLTQTANLRTQGVFSPGTIENALDKTMMAIQETRASAGSSGDSAVATHVGQSDPHTQYLRLTGRSGGQHARGGTAASENLQLSSTSHGTKGKLLLGSVGTELVIDDVNKRVGIGTATPSVVLDVVGAVALSSTLTVAGDVTFSGGTTALLFASSDSSIHLVDNDTTALDIGPTGNLDLLRFDTTNGSEGLALNGYGAFGSNGTNQVFIDSSATQGEISNIVDSGILFLNGGAITIGAGQLELYGSSHATNPGGAKLQGANILLSNSEGDPSTTIGLNGPVYGARKLKTDAGIAEILTAPGDCNGTIFVATDNTVVTLPALPNAGTSTTEADGCEITVIVTAAAGSVLLNISPDATDDIEGSCLGITGAGAATLTERGGVVGKDIILAKATQNKGDGVTLVANNNSHVSAGTWYIKPGSCIGEWSDEP